jgi:hypothetical protein
VVDAVTTNEANAVAVLLRHDPPAVDLLLVHPAVAVERFRGLRGDHRAILRDTRGHSGSRGQPSGGTIMNGARTAAVLLLIASVLMSCATPPPPSAPDTEMHKKVRTDVEQCNTAAGGRAQSIVVTPEGKYSFQIIGAPSAETILVCMRSKGYSGVRLDNPADHGGADMIRSGGEGQALRN